MIFVIQTAGGRDVEPLASRLRAQSAGVPNANVLIVPDQGNEGELRGMIRALDIGRRADGRVLTLLEDDVEVCDGFVPYVCARWADPGPLVVRWYAPGDVPEDAPSGWLLEPGRNYLCNQATTMTVGFVDRLLESQHLGARLRSRDRHSGDALIADVLGELGWHMATRVPGLVQHAGEKSLVSPNSNPLRRRFEDGVYHRSRRYIGSDVDPRRGTW